MSEVETPTIYLIVEWKTGKASGGYSLISEEKLLDSENIKDLHTGKVVSVEVMGKSKKAHIVMVSTDKHFLEMEFKQLMINPDNQLNDESSDFCDSGSDWDPNIESESENNVRKSRKPPPKKLKRESSRKHKKMKNPRRTSQNNLPYIDTPTNSQTFLNDRVCQPIGHSSYAEDVYTFNPKTPPVHMTSYQPVAPYHVEIKNTCPPMTFDQQTQTSIELGDIKSIGILHSNQEALRMDLHQLRSTVESLRMTVETMYKTIDDMKFMIHDKSRVENGFQNGHESPETNKSIPIEYEEINNRKILKDNSNISNNSSFMVNSENSPPEKSIIEDECDEDDMSDMISIGTGKTLVPKHVYDQIKWGSYTQSTRKLLMAIFPRKTLATHSLTGKSSPAFKTPAKMQLDTKKVSDIIMTVSRLCNVPEAFVRSAITVKCADEFKMFRQRQEKLKKNKKDKGQENIEIID